MTDTHISERYEFRNIKQNEAEEAAEIERICFPPNEACSKKHMKDRVAGIADLFLVAIDKENGKMAGFLKANVLEVSHERSSLKADLGSMLRADGPCNGRRQAFARQRPG